MNERPFEIGNGSLGDDERDLERAVWEGMMPSLPQEPEEDKELIQIMEDDLNNMRTAG